MSELNTGSDAGRGSRSTHGRLLSALASTPRFPEQAIFNALPLPIRTVCEAIPDQDERAVFISSSLGMLSGCLPNVSGSYARRKYGPALFMFVVAPSGSGKGALGYARHLGRQIDRLFQEEFEKELARKKARQHKKARQQKNTKTKGIQ